MTLQEAVEILKRHRHRGGDDWLIAGVRVTGAEPVRVVGRKTVDNFTAFEAIAIAEKYAAGDTPDSIMQAVLDEVGPYN